jgi:uncharacterized membrane protein YedE/YeeE
MSLPLTGGAALGLGVVFGALFGALLQRGRLTSYDVIVNQFRLRDFTVAKVMLTAILVGGIGVFFLKAGGHANYHIKAADLLAVISGAGLFGIGMVLLGYCPGTGIAAVATGSAHALLGLLGMLVGGIFYALSFAWLKSNVFPVWSQGKVRLPDLTGIPDPVWFLALLGMLGALGLWTRKGKAPVRRA